LRNAGSSRGKLSVSRPNDPYEREADQVAEQVMRMSDLSAGPPAIGPAAAGRVQRACAECEEEAALQRKAAGTGAQANLSIGPRMTADGLLDQLGVGRPLEPAARAFFEPRFGRDFSAVRVHDDSLASDSARALHAQAYAFGPHLVFAAGSYAPATEEGRLLLAHELTHVAQGAAAVVRRDPDDEGDDDDDDDNGPLSVEDEWNARLEDLVEAQQQLKGVQESETATETVRSSSLLMGLDLDPPGYQRARIIMEFWQPTVLPTLADADAVDARVTQALEIAGEKPAPAGEQKTLELLGKRAEYYLQTEPEAFPVTWAERVRILLKPDADEIALGAIAAQSWKTLLDLAQNLPAELFAHGLPVPFHDATMFVGYHLVPALARIDQDHPVKRFAQAALNWGLAQSSYNFLHAWNTLVSLLVTQLASGATHIDYAELEAFKSRQLSEIKAVPDLLRKGWLSAPDLLGFPPMPDRVAVRIATVHFLQYPQYDEFWKRAAELFDAKLREADARIAALDADQRVAVGAKWATELGYESAAWKEVGKGLWEQAPEMLESAGEFTLAHMVAPEIMVFVDLYYAGKAAWDAGVTVPREIEDATELVKSSTSIVDLQRNEAQLKLVQTGGVARQVLDAIAIRGGVKGAGEALERRAARAAESLSQSVEHTRTRAEILERTKSKNVRLEDDEVAAESEIAGERKPQGLTEDVYDQKIDLPNEHYWKRRRSDGVWCRFSPGEVCDLRFKPKSADPLPPPTAATPAPRPDVEATRMRLERAKGAQEITQARLAEAEARARQASQNLKYASAERLKATKGDVETAKKLLRDAQEELDKASEQLKLARETAELAHKEAGRQSRYLERQIEKAEQLEAAQREFNEFSQSKGNVRPATVDGGLKWDELEKKVEQRRGELRQLGEEATRLLPETQAKLRAGTPPKAGTTARQQALDNARANFASREGLTKDGQPIDIVTGEPLKADISPDHIYAVDSIFQEPGFNLLTYEEAAAILELPENYMQLRLSVNKSKSGRSLSEWFKTPEGSRVTARQQLLDLEERARAAVREAIFKKLAERGITP
jgi:hypothetical protein